MRTSGDESIEPCMQEATHTAVKIAFPDQKYKKALVTRIIKAVKGPFEDALRKESEICQKPFEKELANLDKLLENSLLSRRDFVNPSNLRTEGAEAAHVSTSKGESRIDHQLNKRTKDGSWAYKDTTMAIISPEELTSKRQRRIPGSNSTNNGFTTKNHESNGYGSVSSYLSDDLRGNEPLTPVSSAGDTNQLSRGGIPWYMEPFDPVGTTIHEERWTGRELVRGMSEELSDMDEEELSGLVEADEVNGSSEPATPSVAEIAAKAKAKARKRRLANARRRMPWG